MIEAAPASSISLDIPRQTVAEIIARLDAELAHHPGAIVATDADGTLWDGDVGDAIFDALLEARAVREAARPALAAEAAACGLSTAGDANALAATLLDGFKTGRYPPDRNYAMVAWAFAGWRAGEVRAFADRVIEAWNIEPQIRPELRAVQRWASLRGVDFYVVSASPVAIAASGAARLGIDEAHVIAMTPAVDADGVVLPELDGPAVYGEGKLLAIERARPGATLLAVCGDGAWDAPMLRVARVPVAVTPSPGLRDLLHTIPGIVVLAR
jgi:HAD superfamily phosphoserine phosphatase-like hydrolase